MIAPVTISKTEFISLNTPVGDMIAAANENGIISLEFLDADKKLFNTEENFSSQATNNTHLKKLKTQLTDYFSGNRKTFDLPLSPSGTEFQKRVWIELQKIAFGKTRTYKAQSIAIGNLKSIRAVATANGANPIAIIIPCHRVIGSDGSLIGYAGGLWRKKWLLEFEQKLVSNSTQLSLSDSLQ